MQNEYHLVTGNWKHNDGAQEAAFQSPPDLPPAYRVPLHQHDTSREEMHHTYAPHLPHQVTPMTHQVTGPFVASVASHRKHSAQHMSTHHSYTHDKSGLETCALASVASSALATLACTLPHPALCVHASQADLQTLILAQELVKLRTEIERLQLEKKRRAVHLQQMHKQHMHMHHVDMTDECRALRHEILVLQARKAHIIHHRDLDVKSLRIEIQKLHVTLDVGSPEGAAQGFDWHTSVEAHGSRGFTPHNVGGFMSHDSTGSVERGDDREVQSVVQRGDHREAQRVVQDYAGSADEQRVLLMVRGMRMSLSTATIPYLAAHNGKHTVKRLIQMSNNKVQEVVKETRHVAVGNVLETESLRLVVENAHLRLALNAYSVCLCHKPHQCTLFVIASVAKCMRKHLFVILLGACAGGSLQHTHTNKISRLKSKYKGGISQRGRH